MGGLLKQYIWVANVVIILFCTYFLAKIVNVYVGRALEVRKSIGVMKKAEEAAAVREIMKRSDFDIITERNIFDSSDTGSPAEPCEGPNCGGEQAPVELDLTKEAVKTTLPVKVLSILMVGNGEDSRSSATVEMNKKADVFAVKEKDSEGKDRTFSPGAILVRVTPTRIEFVNSNRLEYASLEEEVKTSIFGPPTEAPKVAAKSSEEGKKPAAETPGVKAEGGKIVVDQRMLDNSLSDLNKLLTEIRAVPQMQNNKMTGLKVMSFTPNSIFSKLGIKRGDLLVKVNGIDLDIKTGMQMFSQLREQKNFTLDLVRGGVNQTLEYEVK